MTSSGVGELGAKEMMKGKPKEGDVGVQGDHEKCEQEYMISVPGRKLSTRNRSLNCQFNTLIACMESVNRKP